MKSPVVNLEETFGKIVGNNISGATDYDRLVDAAEQFMPTLPFPKGVYRFRSFEEADQWTEHYILKAARKKNLALPNPSKLPTLFDRLRSWFGKKMIPHET